MRAAKLIVAVLCLLLVGVLSNTSEAHDEGNGSTSIARG